MGLESIKIVKASDLPAETLAKYGLPNKGFIEVRMEKDSPLGPKFKVLKSGSMDNIRKDLKEKDMLF